MRRYWTPRYPDVYEPQPVEAVVEEFSHQLRRAVARQRPGHRSAAVLLSGGIDSRLLVGALAEHEPRLETITFGIPGCDDARVAEEVAAAVGTRHHFLELKPDWLLGSAREAVRVTDGLANVVNLHVLATRDAQAATAQILYKGFMGDAILGFALKPQMWAGYERDAAYAVHLGVHASQGVINYGPAEQAGLLTDAFRAKVGDGVLQGYREGMDRAGVPDLAAQRLFFDLTQRVPRMTLNGVEAARTRTIVRLPFCDNDFVDFALGVPPGFLFERALPKAALVEQYPRLARIPLASTGRPLISCARDIGIQARSLLSWHLRKHGLGRLARLERRPYKNYDLWFRTTLKTWLADTLLHPRALGRGYFQPAYVRRLVEEQAAGATHAVRLGAMLSLELWHREFID
jgi:asparagine synthase (glutamine-hydrolysing)